MKIPLIVFLVIISLTVFGQDTIHKLEYSDGLKVGVQIVSTDAEDAPDFFVGGRLLSTLYVMKNFSTIGTARISAGFNYIEGNLSFGADGFIFPFHWHRIKLNSGVFVLSTTPKTYGMGTNYVTYSAHLVRLNNLRVLRLFGFHGSYRYKFYGNGSIEAGSGNDRFKLNKLQVAEISAGLVLSSRRCSQLKIVDVNSTELGARKNWKGTAAHWLIWAVYADLIVEQANFVPSPVSIKDDITTITYTPVWNESLNPFPQIGWRAAADIWYTRRSYSKGGTNFWGFSMHFSVSKTCFSWFSTQGYSFYPLLGITFSRISRKHRWSNYHDGKIAPDLKRAGDGPNIIVL